MFNLVENMAELLEGGAPCVRELSLGGSVETVNLNPWDQIVPVRWSGASAVNLDLPPVGEAKGRVYCVWPHSTTGGNLTLRDAGDADVPSFTNLVITTNAVVVFSDGRYWHILSTG